MASSDLEKAGHPPYHGYTAYGDGFSEILVIILWHIVLIIEKAYFPNT